MASEFRLSTDAEKDLADIAAHTVATFGEDRGHRYRTDLRRAFELLIAFPKLGKAAGHIASGLGCYVYAAHAIH